MNVTPNFDRDGMVDTLLASFDERQKLDKGAQALGLTRSEEYDPWCTKDCCRARIRATGTPAHNFTPAEFRRLEAAKGAIAAGYYNDQPGVGLDAIRAYAKETAGTVTPPPIPTDQASLAVFLEWNKKHGSRQ